MWNLPGGFLEILSKLPFRYIEDPEYAYAVGRVRALEVNLIDRAHLDRLLKAGLDDIGRILSDTDYAHRTGDMLNPSKFDTVLEDEKVRVLKLIDGLIPDEKVRNLLHTEYDFYNARVLLKGKIFERDISHVLVSYGNIEVEQLKEIFASEEYEKLPEHILSAVQKAISIYYNTKDIREIDFVFDREYMFFMNTTPCVPYLQDYYRILTDITNYKSLLRWKVLELDKMRFRDVLIEGGFIPAEVFYPLVNEQIETIPNQFSRWVYSQVFSEGTRYLVSNRSFVRYEALSDRLLDGYLKQTSYLVFGVEPIISYLLKKMREIKNLRIIMVGKFNGIEEGILTERVVA